MSSKKCSHCNQPLNVSQFKANRSLKSCPSCSEKNGLVHVYHPYPDDFGTTPLRATPNNPDGPQSYCVLCRAGNVPQQGTLCNTIID